MFVEPERARALAAEAVAAGPGVGDPQFRAWTQAAPGTPLLVRDLSGRASYWLVPIVAEGRAVGSVRVDGEGRVAAVQAFRPGSAVSAMDGMEIAHLVRRELDPEAGETAGAPVLIHDGPPGREAWRIEVARGGQPMRWIFVTPGGTYSRPIR